MSVDKIAWIPVALAALSMACWFACFSGERSTSQSRSDGTRNSNGRVQLQVEQTKHRSQKIPGKISTVTEGKTYQELLELFELAKGSTSNELERRQEMCRIIEKMVSLGHYEDAKKIVTEFDAGVLRDGLIHSLFSTNPENLDVLVKRVGESGFNQRDQTAIWTGIMQNLSDSDGPSRVAFLLASNHTLKSEETGFLIQGAIHYINPGVLGAFYWSDPSDSSKWPDEAEAARRIAEVEGVFAGLLARKPELGDSFYSSLITELRGPMTSESLSVFIANYESLDPKSRGKLGGEVMNAMFAESPSKALNAIKTLADNPDLPLILSSGIRGWLRNDSKAAKAWLASDGAALGQQSYDAMTKTLATFFAERNQIDEASTWSAKISDPTLRSQAEGVVWSKERDALRNDVVKDPVGTVQSIISGQSTYDGYWLEEAMTTWVAKDFDTAQGWYQQNWQTLPASKAQYVAAAFATHAVKQGDMATARQWVGYIQNPKTKQRIEAGIAKAEHADSQQ